MEKSSQKVQFTFKKTQEFAINLEILAVRLDTPFVHTLSAGLSTEQQETEKAARLPAPGN